MIRRIPPGPTIDHVRQLLEHDASRTGIAKAAGCAHATIHALAAGTYGAISADLAERIAAVTIDQCRRSLGGPPLGPQDSHATGDWSDHPDRACRGLPMAAWFPERRNTGRAGGHDANYLHAVAQAKARCARCPVLDECRAHGIAHEPWGIWGGLTETEREQARRRGAA